ncbi:MAG: hypothetical protein M3Y65_08000 [Pseudomonadota bacterium]|nr:hypothetical protein [Pseudomonadota bacterium]
MRTLIRLLPLIALLAAPLHGAGAAQASGSMAVSFTIVASCTVDGNGMTAPAVACAQADSFTVAPSKLTVANSNADGWTVYF